jgi:transcriptional regulator with XRE-family HTH domain
MSDDVRRIVRLLEGQIRRSRSDRGELERTLGLAPGTLDDLLAGRAELTVRQLLVLARELGLDPALLLQGDEAGEQDPVLDEVERAFREMRPRGRGGKPAAGAPALASDADLAAVKELVRETIRDELARLARGERSGRSDERDEDPGPGAAPRAGKRS